LSKVNGFSDLMNVTLRAEVEALRYSTYSYVELAKVIGEVAALRNDRRVRAAIKYNYQGPSVNRLRRIGEAGQKPTSSPASSYVTWEEPIVTPTDRVYMWGDIDIYLSAHTTLTGLRLMLHVNLGVLPAQDAEAILRGIESIATAQSASPSDLDSRDLRDAFDLARCASGNRRSQPSPCDSIAGYVNNGQGCRQSSDYEMLSTQRKERIFRDAIERAANLNKPSMTLNYMQAGGAVMKIRNVIAHLADRGYAGLTVDDFLNALSLQNLARKIALT
jgi:hypothetical protein